MPNRKPENAHSTKMSYNSNNKHITSNSQYKFKWNFFELVLIFWITINLKIKNQILFKLKLFIPIIYFLLNSIDVFLIWVTVFKVTKFNLEYLHF